MSKWTGRVIKHLSDDDKPACQWGTAENRELLKDYYPPLTVIATPEDEGKTIRDVLERAFGVSSKLLAAVRMTDYGLTINEERVYISAPVQAGEVIRLRMLKEYSEDIMPQPMLLSIVYEDDFLLIVNKPAGIVVHPTHGHYTNTLANGVTAYWQQQGKQYRFRPIHRLDEETSGLVAIAKNPYIHQQLSEQLQQGKVDKRYAAIVYGAPIPSEGCIEGPIARDPNKPHLRIVTSNGAPSKTIYELKESYCGGNADSNVASLISLKLLTGRTHQIRVHMRSIGHPLIGDKLYGIESMKKEQLEHLMTRHALHAEQLGFYHPMTKHYMSWQAPMPEDMEQLIRYMKKGIEQ